MTSLLINNPIIVFAWLLGLILAVGNLTASGVNRKRFKVICLLYKEKFGSLPPAVGIFDDRNSFFNDTAYSLKMQFIFRPLLWGESANFTKSDDTDFIRGLPKRIIWPFYVEIYLAIAALIFFITAVVAGLCGVLMKFGEMWLASAV